MSAVLHKFVDVVVEILGAAWRGFWRLSLVGKLLVIGALIVGTELVAGNAGLSGPHASAIRTAVAPIALLVLLIVIIATVISPGRRR